MAALGPAGPPSSPSRSVGLSTEERLRFKHPAGSGTIDDRQFFADLDRAGYVGLEYRPAGNTEEGLDAWLPRAARANR